MKTVRITLNILIVLSTTLLVGSLALDKLNETNNQYLVNLLLMLMHSSFLFGSVVNLIYFFKNLKIKYLILISIPLILFSFAFVGIYFIFDFYLIFLFSFLTLNEFINHEKVKS
jgi:hypothetical protein